MFQTLAGSRNQKPLCTLIEGQNKRPSLVFKFKFGSYVVLSEDYDLG